MSTMYNKVLTVNNIVFSSLTVCENNEKCITTINWYMMY